MKLSELFQQDKFVITCENGPPKGTDVTEMLENAELMRGRVDAMNITDAQASVMRLGSLAACALLKQRGVEPIYQVTCRDRNRIALQSDLLSAAVLGIENVLALTGDYVGLGDHPDTKPVFDLDSVSLLETVKYLQNGHDLANEELKGKPSFCVGAVVAPAADPVEPQIFKMERKVKAGAQFFQTQAVYDPKAFESFMNQVKHLNVAVMVGIVLLRSAGMARYMNKNVAGIHVPEALIEEMDKAEDRAKKGVEIAGRLIREMKGMCQGVHVMAIGTEKLVPAILDAAGL
jgi:methylenetetrahydrofolate reductase (NADPH)